MDRVCGKLKNLFSCEEGRGHLEDLGVDGKIVFKWVLEE